MSEQVGCPPYSSTTYNLGWGRRQFYFRPQSSDIVFKQVLEQQQYDLRRLRRVSELFEFVRGQEGLGLRPLVVDAGANIGASTVYFTGKLPNVLVVAIEPNLENFKLLCKNVEGAAVEPVHAAISSTEGRAQVLDPGEGHWGYRTRPIGDNDTDAGSVNRITVNDIYSSHATGFFPFIVKIDVEGAEHELFSENTEWIARTPLVIVELHDWLLPKAGISRPFLRCISQLDRDFVIIGEDIYSIANDLSTLCHGQSRP
jgi:FkbM family methyltransferase